MSTVHDSEDQLHSSEEEYQEESHERTLNRPSKRTRTNDSKPKAPRKKYVKGKQGGLQGVMKMPMEVFTEIAHHVHPGDLISLIRTNKFFRAMLLNQSAILIWQRALSNVPELPSCPTGLIEPQYAALVFSKNCTLCGALAKGKPDPFLQVRLCSSCRDTELEEKRLSSVQSGDFTPWSMHIKRSRKSVHKHPIHHLIRQKRELEGVQDEFVRKGDQQGLTEWKLQRQKTWEIQRKEGKQLLEFLNSVAASRSDELKDRRSERREQIRERLRALGWEDKYFCFYKESAKKQWDSLVEVSKPVTDRTWTNMLPKLTQLLEENRLHVDEFHRQRRRNGRVAEVRDFLRQPKRNMHPYQSIVDALQLERSPIQIGYMTLEVDPLLSNPFPEEQIIRGWDFLASIYSQENGLERVAGLLNERRDAICQKLLEWRTQVENQLVEQYKSSFAENVSLPTNAGTTLTIQGNTDAAKHLSDNALFLLRADTVFMVKAPAGSSEIDQEHGPAAESIHFPAIPCIRNNPSFNDSSNHGFYPYTGANALDCYVRHPGKEAIVKALLRELQMPDAAYVELENMGKVFICGRCNHNRPTEWDALVEHYHLRRRDWVGNTFIPNSYQTRHPVIFRNLHDLGSDTNPKPLVRIASSEGNNGTPVRSYDVVAECIICRGIDFYDECSFESSARMREHMQELHGTVEPVEKLHFIDEARNLSRIFFWAGFDRRDWEQKWDRFHDTLGATGATVHQTDSRSGSTSQTTNSSQVPRIVSA